MERLEYIARNITALPNGKHFLSYREVQELPQILTGYEDILHLANATLENYKGVLVATNKRLLFLYIEQESTRYFQIQYGDIQHVYHQYGNTQSPNTSYGNVGGMMKLSLMSRNVQVTDLYSQDIEMLLRIIEKFKNNISANNSYTYTPNTYTPVKKGSLFGGFLKLIGFITLIFLLVAFAQGFIEGFIEGFEEASNSSEEVITDYLEDGISKEEAEKAFLLKFSPLTIEEAEYSSFVVGEITNESNQDYGSIYLNLHFFDKDGKVIDSSLVSIDNLKSGQTWGFKGEYFDKNITDFKIAKVEVFH